MQNILKNTQTKSCCFNDKHSSAYFDTHNSTNICKLAPSLEMFCGEYGFVLENWREITFEYSMFYEFLFGMFNFSAKEKQ